MRKKFLVIGRVTLDCYAELDRSIFNIFLSKFTTINSVKFFPGGGAANTSIWLSALGANVEMHAAVGNDMAGNYISRMIQQKGITLKCQHVERDTSISFIFLDKYGEPHFLHSPGANNLFDPSISLTNTDADIIYIGGVQLLPRLAKLDFHDLIQSLKVKPRILVAGLCHGGRAENLLSILSGIQILLGTINEFHQYTKNPEELFRKSNSLHSIIVTEGQRGAIVYQRERIIKIPTEPIQPIDACGAGDAFASGVLIGLSHYRSMEESCALGNAVAAINCGAFGPSTPPDRFKERLIKRFHWLTI